MATKFVSLFHRFSYILKPLDGGSWFSATENWQLTDTEILKAAACAHPRYIVGARSGRASRYAVLDIDAKSKYHNKHGFDKIVQTLATAGLNKPVAFRSSYSDGWHIYLFFDEPISSKDLRDQLFQLFKLNGFTLAKGTFEIFPHPGLLTDGQGLRLPLQPGFAWLDQKTLEVEHDRAEFSAGKAMTYFLDELEHSSHSRHDFHRAKAHIEKLSTSYNDALIAARTFPQPGSSHTSETGPTRKGVIVPFRPVTSPNSQRPISSAKSQPGKPTRLALNEIDFFDFDDLLGNTPTDHFEMVPGQPGKPSQRMLGQPGRSPGLLDSTPGQSEEMFGQPDLEASLLEFIFGTTPPNINASSWFKGREYAATGLSGPSQRAEAIFCLSHYLFYGDPEYDRPALGYGYEQQRAWIIEQLLAERHNGHSSDINASRADAYVQVSRAANWLPQHKRSEHNPPKPYDPVVPIAWVRHNENLRANARARITAAVADFTGSNEPFSIRKLVSKSGCCSKTLYKHKDLWQKQQADLLRSSLSGESNATNTGNSNAAGQPIAAPSSQLASSGCLASVRHEYNAGVGAAPQKSLPPAASNPNLMPPGRLASKRIVFELVSRAKRDEQNRQRSVHSSLTQSSEIWNSMILDAMPSNLPEAASKDILASLTLMRTMLPRSPGEDEQNWLLGLIDQLKSQLSSRRLMTIPTSTRLCGSPIDIHLADPSPSGNAASPVDDGHEIAETIADYAGPPPLSFQAQFNLDIPISNPARSESDNL